nr:MAG TPA: hypothetical protein [Bacteriophage sp.]
MEVLVLVIRVLKMLEKDLLVLELLLHRKPEHLV